MINSLHIRWLVGQLIKPWIELLEAADGFFDFLFGVVVGLK